MTLKWGSTVVTAVKWGSTKCTKVYWGNTLVFPIQYTIKVYFGSDTDNYYCQFTYSNGETWLQRFYTKNDTNRWKINTNIPDALAIIDTDYGSDDTYPRIFTYEPNRKGFIRDVPVNRNDVIEHKNYFITGSTSQFTYNVIPDYNT